MRSAESAFQKTQPAERSWWQRYGVAIGAVFVGWISREAITAFVGPTALPFIFFFPAVAVVSWYGAWRPGVLSAVTAAGVANWFFFDTSNASIHRAPSDVVATLSFLFSSFFIIAAIETMHRASDRLTRETVERCRAESVSAQAQESLKTTLASIGDGVIVTDVQGRINFMNAEAERLTQWTGEQAKGQPLGEVFRIVSEITRKPVESPAEGVLRTGKIAGLANHTLLLTNDGREVPIDDSAAPIRTGGGPIFGVVLVFRDVTEQRRAGMERARLAAIVESSGDAIVAKDLNGIVQTWNAGAERMFGYRPEEIVGKSITTIIPRERMNEEVEILSDLRNGRPHHRLETIRVAKDGTPRHVSLTVSPLKDAEGRVIGASKIIHDISDIVASRDQLVREREMLSTTLRSIGDGVIVTDAGGVVTFVNPEAERLTGWSQAEAASVPLTEMFHIVNEETRNEVENPVQEVLRTGLVVGLANHTLLLARDGVERPIDDSAAPILHADGRIFGVVLVFRDFTERRAAEQALRNSEAALQDELRRKDEFLAILSHELRNPLAPIRSAVVLLKRLGPPLPELQELRDIIDRQTTQLTRLLDDLLDVSRISSGKIALRKEVVDLSTAIASATESVRPLVASRGQELTVQLSGQPIHVLGDPTRLAQVFANLLSNASKYTESGGHITLTADCNDGEGTVRVSDPGIGISPDQIRRIFEMFAQVQQPPGKEQAGLGIGLALARNLVEMHAGTIEARSDGLGHGSEFIVRLPALPPLEPAERRPSDREGRGVSVKQLRILLADDNVDSALTMAMTLRIAGHDVHVVHDGVAAVEAAKSFSPDIAILDIGMPMMDGYVAAREIRHSVASPITLVAVTGWGQESDKRRAAEAGFDHHLTKPVDFPVLEQVIGAVDCRRGL